MGVCSSSAGPADADANANADSHSQPVQGQGQGQTAAAATTAATASSPTTTSSSSSLSSSSASSSSLSSSSSRYILSDKPLACILCGSVGIGKSTLLTFLIHNSNNISSDNSTRALFAKDNAVVEDNEIISSLKSRVGSIYEAPLINKEFYSSVQLTEAEQQALILNAGEPDNDKNNQEEEGAKYRDRRLHLDYRLRSYPFLPSRSQVTPTSSPSASSSVSPSSSSASASASAASSVYQFPSVPVKFRISNYEDFIVGDDQVEYCENVGVPSANIFIIAYSVTDRHSFDNCLMYLKRIRSMRASSSVSVTVDVDGVSSDVRDEVIVLVALKCDVDPSQHRVSNEEGRALAQKLNASFVNVSTLELIKHERNLLSASASASVSASASASANGLDSVSVVTGATTGNTTRSNASLRVHSASSAVKVLLREIIVATQFIQEHKKMQKQKAGKQ